LRVAIAGRREVAPVSTEETTQATVPYIFEKVGKYSLDLLPGTSYHPVNPSYALGL